MTLIVSDTGPIHYLVLIGHIELLPQFAERIVLPASVYRELMNAHAPAVIRQWAADLPLWVEIQSAGTSIEAKGLSAADRESIALATELHADLLLTDDRRARQRASAFGVATMGTLGLLEAAARRGLIFLPSALEKLRGTSIFLTDDLIENALQREMERQNE